jgi:putative holliday junction resolvase
MANGDPATGAVCVLGFDVGSRRIGIALGNTLSGTARPLAVVEVGAQGADWRRIESLIRDWRPDRLIVGEPLTLDGASQPATVRARAFAHEMGARFALPVDLVDERSSSREADQRFAERRRSGQARRRDGDAIDAVAAEVIIERWLQAQPAARASDHSG